MKIDQKIYKIMTESTGEHMCDSGSAYGRNWERNQIRTLKNFKNEPRVSIDKDGCLSKSVFHFLVERLDETQFTNDLNKLFKKFMKSNEENWLCNMRDFAEQYNQGDDKPIVENTYNGECILSQTLQFAIFHNHNCDYVILQIHNGCDVRGGYTEPYIFEIINGYESFFNWNDVSITTTDNKRYNTDDGYNWYDDGNISKGNIKIEDIMKKKIKLLE